MQSELPISLDRPAASSPAAAACQPPALRPQRAQPEYPDTEACAAYQGQPVVARRLATLVVDPAGIVQSCGWSLPSRFGPMPAGAAPAPVQWWLPGVTLAQLAAECGMAIDGDGLLPHEAATGVDDAGVAQRLLQLTRRDWRLPPAGPPVRRLRIGGREVMPVDTACRALLIHGVWHVVVDAWLRDRGTQDAYARLVAGAEPGPGGVMVTDRAGTVQYANPAMETLAGWPRHELAGRNAATLRRGLQDAGHAAWAELRAGRPWAGPLDLPRADGGTCPVRLDIRPIGLPGRPVMHFLCVAAAPKH